MHGRCHRVLTQQLKVWDCEKKLEQPMKHDPGSGVMGRPVRVKMSHEALPARPLHPREVRVRTDQAAGPTPKSPFL